MTDKLAIEAGKAREADRLPHRRRRNSASTSCRSARSAAGRRRRRCRTRPAYVRGVINLRGAVLPIIDLAARLELSAAEPTDAPRHHRRADRRPGRRPAGRRGLRHPDRQRRADPADAGRGLRLGARLRERPDRARRPDDQPAEARQRACRRPRRGRMSVSAPRRERGRQTIAGGRRVRVHGGGFPPDRRPRAQRRRHPPAGVQGGAGLFAAGQAAARARARQLPRLLPRWSPTTDGRRRAPEDAGRADHQRDAASSASRTISST